MRVLLVCVVAVLVAASSARAGGRYIARWSQASDCADVAKWEVWVVAGAASADPATGVKAGEVVNATAVVCTAVASPVLTVTGHGQRAFYVRAVAGDGAVSGWGGPVVVQVPLDLPTGLTVTPAP